MAAAQLPGTHGHVRRVRKRIRHILGLLAMIFVGSTAAIIGAPAGAWAHPKPTALPGGIPALAHAAGASIRPEVARRAAAAEPTAASSLSPSPHPAPGDRSRPDHPVSGNPAVPAPVPEAPPTRESVDRGVTYLNRMTGWGFVPITRVADEQGLVDGNAQPDQVAGAEPQHQLTAEAPALAIAPAPSHVGHTNQRAHATNMIDPGRLDQSLVYSSAIAIAIAAGGLMMIGFRRRRW